jgi:hypothetical protein
MSDTAAGRIERRVHAPRVSGASGSKAEAEYVDPRPSAVAAEWFWRAATVLRDDRRATFEG